MSMPTFSDDKGNRSSMRVLNFMIVFVILFIWAVLCLQKKQFIAMDQTHVWLIGAAMFGKVVQKGVENDTFGILKGK